MLVGVASVMFLTTGNATVQLASEPEYRGRVTALWSMALVGSTPIGSPVIGALSDTAGPRYALGLRAAACLAAAIIGGWPGGGLRQHTRYRPPIAQKGGTMNDRVADRAAAHAKPAELAVRDWLLAGLSLATGTYEAIWQERDDQEDHAAERRIGHQREHDGGGELAGAEQLQRKHRVAAVRLKGATASTQRPAAEASRTEPGPPPSFPTSCTFPVAPRMIRMCGSFNPSG